MNRRIALLSDIHGNTLALERVLAEIEINGGVDEFWVLGDLAALGYDPVGSISRLSALRNACFVRGNTDHYLVTGERPGPSLDALRNQPEKIEGALLLAAGFGWTAGALTCAGQIEWLAGLPQEFRRTLADGTRLLAVHASPGRDDGTGLWAQMSAAEIRPLLAGAEADLVLVGHTHIPFDRRIDGVRVINPGSLSNPFPPDLRAAYAVLDSGPSGVEVEFRRVAYDLESVIAETKRRKHPNADYIIRHLRGEVQPD